MGPRQLTVKHMMMSTQPLTTPNNRPQLAPFFVRLTKLGFSSPLSEPGHFIFPERGIKDHCAGEVVWFEGGGHGVVAVWEQAEEEG
jgi:hypothetical protein